MSEKKRVPESAASRLMIFFFIMGSPLVSPMFSNTPAKVNPAVERSPRNHFAVFHEFAGEIVRRVSREPDDRGGAFGDGAGRVLTAHVGPDPAWAHAVHSELWQCRRELNRDTIERRL